MIRLTSLLLAIFFVAPSLGQDLLKPIPRRLPPLGGQLDAKVRKELEQSLAKLQRELKKVADYKLAVDAQVLLKAVDFALRHNEFYGKNDAAKARAVLDLASKRIEALKATDAPWQSQRGRLVRGYHSSIDGSVQPYGLVIPEKLALDKPVPLFVWLHGRGDKITDLHFIHRRLTGSGNVHPDNAITLHPFGRQCMGFKSAGEIDVLEAVQHVMKQYKIDPDRVVLMGFSMGGAGAWHVGAHYAEHWAAVSPGAGFAETARYNRLKKEDYPPVYEQQLWTLYDVPNYVRNLFNIPVVAYSGEKDKQIQAARVMEEAYLAHQRKLPHLIGPGMGHRYHPKTLAELMEKMQSAVAKGRDKLPKEVHLQTRTTRYNRYRWVTLAGLEKHWNDSRVDARIEGPRSLSITTKNARRLDLKPWRDMSKVTIQIDGQRLETPESHIPVRLKKIDGKWSLMPLGENEPVVAKRHGIQGPIDDAFMAPFLVVVPSRKCANEKVDRWVRFELDHFKSRWQGLYRGELRIRNDYDVSHEDIRKYNLIVFGDPSSNKIIKRVLSGEGHHRLPLQWDAKELRLAGRTLNASHHVPLMIYPNPLNPSKYIVFNSGPTHREGHDRTNSLQNPKLPDWALLDLNTPPSALSAGKVIEAGFFDESWK